MENLSLVQRRKVGVAGSFQNQMMGNNRSIPVVGQGATELLYSDRHAYYVVEVSNGGKSCKIQRANYKYCGSGYGDESYEYNGVNESYSPIELVYRNGAWRKVVLEYVLDPEYIKDLEIRSEGKSYLRDLIFEDGNGDIWNEYSCWPCKFKPGVTIIKKRFPKISILFGHISEYCDPSF